jgi:hypothetical protein
VSDYDSPPEGEARPCIGSHKLPAHTRPSRPSAPRPDQGGPKRIDTRSASPYTGGFARRPRFSATRPWPRPNTAPTSTPAPGLWPLARPNPATNTPQHVPKPSPAPRGADRYRSPCVRGLAAATRFFIGAGKKGVHQTQGLRYPVRSAELRSLKDRRPPGRRRPRPQLARDSRSPVSHQLASGFSRVLVGAVFRGGSEDE